MRITRRRWLGTAAAAAASVLVPLPGRAGVPTTTGESADAPARMLRLCFGAGAVLPALHEAICSVVATQGTTALRSVELPALVSRPAPRLDVLVEQLRAWKGKVLLGAVAADHAFLLDEAFGEIGAAWWHRGEHAVASDGSSRHRLTLACQDSGGVELRRFSGWHGAPAQEWHASLGADMAALALAPHLPAAAFPSMSLETSVRTSARASMDTESYLSFVTRI